ncbi:uncharacterized protein [Macrobrachium rosenbergii]|uniref:uncharacterized protein n=1 Tax=Macrobrachium rosenbergii TaxID=79674 RepID=UPI0034D6CA8C
MSLYHTNVVMDKEVMEEAITCAVCSEEYRSGKHDPLILQCGHTFCRSCITNIKDSKKHFCPTCRDEIGEDTYEKLPMNFSILSLSENMPQFKPKTCALHGKLLDLWCSHCQVVVCGLCVVSDHRQETHEILSAQERLIKIKNEVKCHSEEVNHFFSKKQSLLYNRSREILISLLNLFGDHRHLSHLKVKVAGLCKEASEVTDVELAELCQAKLNSIQSVVSSMMGQDEFQLLAAAGDDDNSAENENVSSGLDPSRSRQKLMPSIPYMELPWPLTISVKDDACRYANLTWEDSKLLLSSFQTKIINSTFVIKWNMFALLLHTKDPEVFMDLTYGDCYLGKVYIRLWGHLRRAHNFLALCLGSLGPSYAGGHFKSSHKDEAKERICGCVYKTTDGSTSTKGVMGNLEWDGKFAGKSAEGRVVGTSGGKGEMDALFSIYTKVDHTASCYCPFGDVSAGLDVVQRAVECSPATSVMVSRCGVVVPPSALVQYQKELENSSPA